MMKLKQLMKKGLVTVIASAMLLTGCGGATEPAADTESVSEEADTKEDAKEETAKDEPSVIIAQRPCALLKTVKYTGRCVITDKCRNCKMCLKAGCPAITVKDGKPVIDATQCNGCGLCMNICPFDAIEKEEA